MSTVQIPQREYRLLRTLEGMDFELQAVGSQLTRTSHNIGVSSIIRTASPEDLASIASRPARTQAYSLDACIPLDETPTGTGSVYDAILSELVRRYSRALGVTQRQAAETAPSAEV